MMLILSAACAAAQSAPAEQLDTSLRLIPNDAAFYAAVLHTRRQLEAVAASRAWASLKEMPISRECVRLRASPVVRLALHLAKARMDKMAEQAPPDSLPAQARQIQTILEDPQVRSVLALLGDMLSQEVFVYGDQSFLELVELTHRLNVAMRYGLVVENLIGQVDGVNHEVLPGELFVSTLVANLDLIKTPNLVIGFKLSDTRRAAWELAKIELMGTVASLANPMLKGRFRRTMVAGHRCLTLSLDGAMLPWDDMPLEELTRLGVDPNDVDRLTGRVKELPLVIGLQLRDDYLLLSIGSSTDALARLGGEGRLADLPQMRPLVEFADRRITSIGYLSQALGAKIVDCGRDVDGLLRVVDALLPRIGLDAHVQAQINRAAAALAADLKRRLPSRGAITSLSFLTDRGIEHYVHDWGDHSWVEGYKPLALLEPVGARPLLAAVLRTKCSPDDRPLDATVCLDWAGLVDALTPRIDRAVQDLVESHFTSADGDEAAARLALVREHVHTVLAVLKTLRTVTSRTYFDRGALVLHTLAEIRDVE